MLLGRISLDNGRGCDNGGQGGEGICYRQQTINFYKASMKTTVMEIYV